MIRLFGGKKMKCVIEGCKAEALYIFQGMSICEAHYQEQMKPAQLQKESQRNFELQVAKLKEEAQKKLSEELNELKKKVEDDLKKKVLEVKK